MKSLASIDHPLKRLLVIGGTGLVGSKVVELAPRYGYEAHNTYNARWGPFPLSYKLDIRDKAKTIELIDNVNPSVIVHTAALHNVDYCETHKEEAFAVNVEGTRTIAEGARRNDSSLLYLSTDYVFDGNRGHYLESDVPSPLHYYASTKLEGEKIVSALSGSAIVRPSVIYGWNSLESLDTPSSSGKTLNFAVFVIERLRKGDTVKAAKDQFSSPTFANSLAEALLEMATREITGLYHLAGRSCISRYEFAIRIADAFDLPARLVRPVWTEELGQLAVRPKNSCLAVDRAEKVLDRQFPTVEQGLAMMRKQSKLIDS